MDIYPLPNFGENPNGDADEAERRRRAMLLALGPTATERFPVYSDTEAGAQGNYQLDAQPSEFLPRYDYQGGEAQVSSAQPTEALPNYGSGDSPIAPPAGPLNLNLPAPGRVDVSDPAPLMVVKDKHGAPTDKVIGDGDRLQKKEAYLQALEDYKAHNHNSRLRSILIGAGRGYLRGGLLGAIFGGVSHAVKPSLDEEFHRDEELAKTGRQVAGEYGRRKIASQLADEDVKRQVELANMQNQTLTANRRVYEDERDAALKNLEKFPALDPKNPIHAEAILRARRAGLVIDPSSWGQAAPHIAFDINSGNGVQYNPLTKSWGPMLGQDGQPISTRPAPKPADIPKTFYNLDGNDEKIIHANAVRNVGGRDFGGGFELDPAKVKLLQQKDESYDQAVDRVKGMLNQGYDGAGNPIHFSDYAKPESQAAAHRYDAAIASAEGPELQKLNLYRLAVDQTSSAPQSAQLMTIDQFQKDYRTFWKVYTDLYKKGKRDEAEAKRAEYFGYIKGVRVR